MKKIKSIGFALLYLAIVICLQFLLGFMMSFQLLIAKFFNGSKIDQNALMEFFQKDSVNIILVALINLIIIMGFGTWYFFIRRRNQYHQVDYKKILSFKSVLCTIILAVASQMLCGIIMSILHGVMPELYKNYEELAKGLELNVMPAWAMIFIVVIWSPLAEELVFRAMIFRTLRKGFSFAAAAIISGALFGVYHMNVIQGIYAGLFGVLLAFVYEKTNSLLGCYLFHLFFNLFSYGLEWIENALGFSDAVMGLCYMVLMALSVVFFIPMCMWFSKLHKKEYPKDSMKRFIQAAGNQDL